MSGNDGKMALVVREVGYGLKRLPECYLLMRWDAGGVNTRGANAGKVRPAGWVSMEKYPSSLESGIRQITEYAMADALDGDDANEALRKLRELLGLIAGRGLS